MLVLLIISLCCDASCKKFHFCMYEHAVFFNSKWKLENVEIKMYCCQLWAPQNTHSKSQYTSTAAEWHLWWQSFLVTEFISTGINNYCLNCRRWIQLHCLKLLTRCQTLGTCSCAVKHDSLIQHNIMDLTCDGSYFYVMTFTFDLITFNICSASTVTLLNHAHVAP